jgi:tetratricopeptide (TPR) repeat protein
MATLTIQQAFDLALQHHQAGRLQEAEQIYQQILIQQPQHIGAMYYLGVIAHQAGRNDIAVDLIHRALVGNPNFADAHCNLASVLVELGDLNEAIAASRRAIELKPDFAEAHNNLGRAFQEMGDWDNAINSFRQAVSLRPDLAEAHSNLGNALRENGLLDAALSECQLAIALRPNSAEAMNSLGSVLKDKGQLDEAVGAYRNAVALKPNFANAQNNLGVALREKGDLNESITAFQNAIALKPNFPNAHNNLGVALKEKGQLDEAIVAYRQAISENPNYAEPHYNLGMTLLLHGEMEQGWPEYEWRWKVRGFPSPKRNFAQPLWDGADLGGRSILIYAEQGIGDTIHCIRYLPMVAQRGGRVIIEVAPSLIQLLQQLPGAQRWIAAGESLPDFDVQCPLLSLPHLFSTTLQSIPTQHSALRADPDLASAWRSRLEQSRDLKVGLAWAGAAGHTNDRNRSIALSEFAPLAAMSGIQFFSLQKGEAAKQIATPPAGMQIIDWTDELQDFADTAALIDGLDLIISVDTAVAHLAAAMGKPVWLLLPFIPDWRWLMDRQDTPWYPTMRLFRQTTRGDWRDVISHVTKALTPG